MSAQGEPRLASIAVLIPAFQAAESLPRLLGELRAAQPALPVLVVDDGSRDGTAEAARSAGAEVFSHLLNQGKGAALRRGWELLFRRGHPAVLSLDADGQHDPGEAGAFLRRWEQSRPDLLVGDRGLARAAMSWDRRLSNRLSTRLLNRASGLSLGDSQCGYRLLGRELWLRLRLSARAFDLESQLLLQAARLGARVEQVPVTQRPAGVPSHIRRLPDSLRFVGRLWEAGVADAGEGA